MCVAIKLKDCYPSSLAPRWFHHEGKVSDVHLQEFTSCMVSDLLCSDPCSMPSFCLLCAILCFKCVICLWCHAVSVKESLKPSDDSALKVLKGFKLLKCWVTLALRLDSVYIMRWLWDDAYKRLSSNWYSSDKLATVGFWWLYIDCLLGKISNFLRGNLWTCQWETF